jgi:transposase
MSRFQLGSGAERRRRCSEEQKRALIGAPFAPGAIVAEVARRAEAEPESLVKV